MNICIYKLISPNGRIYIGQSKDIKTRFRSYNNLNCKSQPKLYRSLKKYNWENFNKEILEYLPEELVDEYERFYIGKFDCVKSGLNCESGGNKQKILSDETKKKLSKSHKGKKYKSGRKLSNEHKRKISEAMKGRKIKPRTEEHNKKLSESKKGKPRSEETRQKIRKSHIIRNRNIKNGIIL